jgi:hypothetical protein
MEKKISLLSVLFYACHLKKLLIGGYIMSLRIPVKLFPSRPTVPMVPKTYRSPAASPRRQYGPVLTSSKTLIKLLSLGLVGLTLSVLLFAAFNQGSSVLLLERIWTESWKPIVAMVLTMMVLASIEESFS